MMMWMWIFQLQERAFEGQLSAATAARACTATCALTIVGDRKHGRQYRQAERLGGLQIDHKKLGGLHYRQVGRLGAFQDFTA
jgi:hypothetical protein